MYCKSCNGSGRKYWSRYGGNDPDVVDVGPCDECLGCAGVLAGCDEGSLQAVADSYSHSTPLQITRIGLCS